jgi:hypothetical protein
VKIPSCESRESRESRAGRDKDLVIHERRESRESRAGRDKDLEIYERRESRESSIEQLSKNVGSILGLDLCFSKPCSQMFRGGSHMFPFIALAKLVPFQ